jgi:KDO2-lipid IV(A) lauroyltransferase
MYYIVYGLLYVFSLLPLRVLFIFSDLVYLLLYYVFGYRKKVVMDNLLQAFPEKTDKERKTIAKKFYRNFTDNWIETIKLLSISKTALNKRVSSNVDVFYQLHKEGRSVQLNLGHFFNWEYMTLYTGINQPYTFLTVYLPQSSKMTNRLFLHLRSRWGNPQLPATDMARAIIPWRKKQHLLALGADQSPPLGEFAYWLYFLNRPTAFLKGPEKFARLQQVPVVMMTTTKPKRGHYHFEYFLLADHPKEMNEGELMRQYAKHLEENIKLQPEIYLWSHKRWKRPWKPEYADLWVDDRAMPDLNIK